MNAIRNSVKAIIIEDGKLLMTGNKDHLGSFYLLPGGGQEREENMTEALKRECMEEISAEISVGDIRYIREYLGKNHEFSQWDHEIHQIEYMFQCKLLTREGLKSGAVPDSMQTGVEWIELSKLEQYRIYPSVLKTLVKADGTLEGKVYLGDVN